MNENQILSVLTKLQVVTSGTTIDSFSGKWVMCSCPLAPYKFEHRTGRDDKPGFGVHVEDDDVSYYSCFTCKSTGTLGGLAMQLGRYREEPGLITYGKELDRQEILGGLIEFKWEENRVVKNKAFDRVTNFPNEYEFERRYRSALAYPECVGYLRRRGISASTTFEIGLRFDERQRRILFPVYDYWTGSYAGCSGRSILGPKTRSTIEQRTGMPQPKVRDYFGLQKDRVILRKRRVSKRTTENECTYGICVEGLFAFATSVERGYGNNTFALLGSAVLAPKATIIADIGLPVYWFTDNDPAGQSCLYGKWDEDKNKYLGGGALDKLYHEVAQFVPSWPEDKNDPDQLTKYEFGKMIADAEIYIKT
jgi:hypothetical protein